MAKKDVTISQIKIGRLEGMVVVVVVVVCVVCGACVCV